MEYFCEKNYKLFFFVIEIFFCLNVILSRIECDFFMLIFLLFFPNKILM